MTPHPTSPVRPLIRWLRRGVLTMLILLTAAIVAAILLPVYRGVSSDSRPRDMMGLPIGEKPKAIAPKK